MNTETIELWNNKIDNFISGIPNYTEINALNEGKGIVICAGCVHFVSSIITIEMLIKQNENIQIEWYYVGDELIEIQKQYLLSKTNIKLINCLDILPSWFNEKIDVHNLKGFMIKPFALMMSNFEDILLLDGDNIPLCNVLELFNCQEYLKHGNIFWKDVLFLSKKINKKIYDNTSNFYENFGIKHYNYSPTESGQILINKKKCWKAICLSYFFNYHYNFFYKIFFGDKDLYYIAFEKTNTLFYQNKYYPHGIGNEGEQFTKVNMLIQRNPINGDYAFLHRTLSKITINQLSSPKYIYKNLNYPLYSYFDQTNMINMNAHNTINSNICLVTAFTDINRHNWRYNSRTKETYFERFKKLIEIINLNLVVFIEKENYEYLIENIQTTNTSSNIKIILYDKNNIESWKYYEDINNILKCEKFKKLTEKRSKNDIETYNAEYLCVTFSKIDFIKLTIDKKLFNTDYYGWIDFGFIKDTKFIPEDNIIKIRSLDENFVHFVSFDFKNNIYNQNRQNLIQNGKVFIPGGFFIGNMIKMIEFNNIFHKTVKSYLREKIIDDDQSIFVDIYNKYNIIKTHKNYNLLKKNNLTNDELYLSSLIYFNETNEYKEDYFISDFLIQKNEEIKEEWHKLRFFYKKTIDVVTGYYVNNINNNVSISLTNVINVKNLGILKNNLYQLKIYVKNNNTFFLNRCLIYYILVKNHQKILSLFIDMSCENIENDETIVILANYLNENNIKLFLKYIKKKYLFYLLYSLSSNNKISLDMFEKLLINNFTTNFFLLKFINFSNLKNINLLNATLDYLLANQKKIPTFSYPIYLNMFYYICFNNYNNVEIKKKISKLHRLLFPSINYVNKNINNYNFNKNRKIKIGFISTNFRLHSVARDRTGIIVNLDKNKFDITIFYFNKFNDFYFNKLVNSGNKNIFLQGNFNNCIKQIENEKLDILVYCDIGMQQETYLLAHCRIVPIQITTWGHSETTGINTIDYYISSILYEENEEIAQQYYSEKIILHQSLCTYYYDQYYDLIYSSKDKNFKLPLKEQQIYLTYCQYLHKISDTDINIFINILKKIKNIKIVFVNGNSSSTHAQQLIDRLGEYSKHIIILPKMCTGIMYDLIQKSYLILDSFPHGGCNTSLECFYYNKIIITKPSKYLRGRFTQGFYKKMNINDCIVNNVNEYVQKVEQFVNNKKYKQEVENMISINKYKLYNDIDSVHEWDKTLEELYLSKC